MKKIMINGDEMTDKASAHAYLKQKLALPEYYGDNLDALWDCLSTDFTRRKIIMSNAEALTENLGTYGSALIRVFEMLAEENEYFEFVKVGARHGT